MFVCFCAVKVIETKLPASTPRSVVVLQNCGHVITMDKPKELTDAVLSFFRRVVKGEIVASASSVDVKG